VLITRDIAHLLDGCWIVRPGRLHVDLL